MNESQLRLLEYHGGLMPLTEELIVEIRRLRQGLFECARESGEDTSGMDGPQHLSYPDIVDWTIAAVRDLRRDYDAMLRESR